MLPRPTPFPLLQHAETVGKVLAVSQDTHDVVEHDMKNKKSQTREGELPDFVKDSALYREFLAEREEILKHKWIESEKAGRDIGFEQALVDWKVKHSAQWKKNRRTAKKETVKN